MSSPNIIKDTPQRHSVDQGQDAFAHHDHDNGHDYDHAHLNGNGNAQKHVNAHSCNGMDLTLNQDIEELKSTFMKMMRPHKAQYAYPRPVSTSVQRVPNSPANATTATATATATASSAVGTAGGIMDIPSRMRAIKVFNVMLARLWRKRCAEVCDLHELVRKYQTKATTMRDDLFRRNKLICREQRRCGYLESQLCRVRNAAELSSQGCETIERELNAARRQQARLRQELRARTQECSNYAELLNVTKTEMFRELSKFRQCAHELAEQQRQNRLLELRNTELEDELLTLKDRFQTQHDNVVVAVHLKQEQLDEAYETLKGYEQELAELELKHTELLKESRDESMLEEIAKVERKIGMVRYVICFISAHRWRLLRPQLPNFKLIAYEIIAKFLDYILHGPVTLPTRPSMGIYLAIVLMIGALY